MTLDTSLCNILSGGDIEGMVLLVTMLGLSSQPSDSCIPLLTIIISGLLESYNLYGSLVPRLCIWAGPGNEATLYGLLLKFHLASACSIAVHMFTDCWLC